MHHVFSMCYFWCSLYLLLHSALKHTCILSVWYVQIHVQCYSIAVLLLVSPVAYLIGNPANFWLTSNVTFVRCHWRLLCRHNRSLSLTVKCPGGGSGASCPVGQLPSSYARPMHGNPGRGLACTSTQICSAMGHVHNCWHPVAKMKPGGHYLTSSFPQWLKVSYSGGANHVSLVTRMSGWSHRVWNWILIDKSLNVIGWFIIYVRT